MKRKQTKWLSAGRQPEYFQPYEDSLTAKVQGKLLQYYDIMQEGRMQSRRDKEILQKPDFTEEKRQIFMTTLEEQIDKLDFLMQSLIHMSRLETGTFVLHPTEDRIHAT